jgi:hypothetical protein
MPEANKDDSGALTTPSDRCVGAVVGLLFWVRADDVGSAAKTAVEAACRAGTESGLGAELYDVVVIPSAAVASRDDSAYPRMPD